MNERQVELLLEVLGRIAETLVEIKQAQDRHNDILQQDVAARLLRRS